MFACSLCPFSSALFFLFTSHILQKDQFYGARYRIICLFIVLIQFFSQCFPFLSFGLVDAYWYGMHEYTCWDFYLFLPYLYRHQRQQKKFWTSSCVHGDSPPSLALSCTQFVFLSSCSIVFPKPWHLFYHSIVSSSHSRSLHMSSSSFHSL